MRTRYWNECADELETRTRQIIWKLHFWASGCLSTYWYFYASKFKCQPLITVHISRDDYSTVQRLQSNHIPGFGFLPDGEQNHCGAPVTSPHDTLDTTSGWLAYGWCSPKAIPKTFLFPKKEILDSFAKLTVGIFCSEYLVKHSSFCFLSLVSSLVGAFLFLLGGISCEWSDSEFELLTVEWK